MTVINCQNFLCKFNEKGNCQLESITLQDDGSMITNKVICIEAEPSGLNVDELPIPGTKPLDLENIWGVPKEDLPETEPKNYFEQCEEELRDECLR